jgi:hypothetical protein
MMIQTEPDMAIWFVILLSLLFMGTAILLAALLANSRTRTVALTLLGLLGFLALVMIGGLFTVRMAAHRPQSAMVYDEINTYPGPFLYHPPSPPSPPSPVENWEILTEPRIPLDDDDSIRSGEEAVAAEVSLEAAEAPEAESAEAESAAVESEASESEESEVASDEHADEKTEATDETPTTELIEEPAAEETQAAVQIPRWINAAPSTVGDVYREVIQAGPWQDSAECHRYMGEKFNEAIQNYLEEIAREELRSDQVSLPSLASMGISMNWIRQNVVSSHPEPFMLTTDSSVGPMKTLYTQLEIDANDETFLRDRWRQYARQGRIDAVVTGGSLVLGGIGLLFGLLKLDTWTKGFYTKRLFLGVPAAIIGGIILAMVWTGRVF